jgi:hypothetical protein
VSTRTDATSRNYTVRRRSDHVPEEALQGLGFPFEVPVKLRLTATRGFRKGLENMVAVDGPKPGWYASDNGFASVEAMDAAHAPVVEAAVAALGGTGGDVLDLGCGNGVLVQKIEAAAPGVVPHGIDVDPARIEHARLVVPRHAGNFVAGDLLDDTTVWPDGRRYAIAVLMPGRLLEAGPERSAALLRRLRERCAQVLVYAYADWLERPGGLAGLAREVGLDPGAVPADASTAIVTVS